MFPFSRFVGCRYLFSKKRHSILSLTTWISVLGVATGVTTLIVVISIMSGFGNDLKDKILNFKSHILIESKDFSPFHYSKDFKTDIQQADTRIQEISPYILTEMMIRNRGSTTGVLLKGIEHKQDVISSKAKDPLPPILLGQELASSLGAFRGDVIEIVSPLETTGPLGTIPKMKKYKVAGLIQTGIYEYDTKLAYVSLQEAQQFLEYGSKIDGLEVKVSNVYQTPSVIQNIKKASKISSFQVRDWQELNRSLLSALKLEKMAMFVVLSFIVLVAALNIITTITRSVLEKRREISILKAMGARRSHILNIFLFQGLLMGVTGIILGMGVGVGVCYVLDRFQLIRLPDIYYTTSIPIDMHLGHFGVIGIIAFVITVISSFYPAWKASKLDPLEGIRY